jgi:hypothetical protein
MEYTFRFVRNCLDVVRFFPLKLGTDTKFSTVFFLMSLALGTSALVITRSLLRDSTTARAVFRMRCRLLAGPVLGALAFILVHSLKSITLRGWYYATVACFLFPVFAVAADYAAAQLSASRQRFAGAAFVLFCLVVGAATGTGSTEQRRGESDKYDAVQVLNEIIPAGSRVGSWNAGVYGYFFRKGSIVNLDGLVNNEAFRHLRSRTLAGYCRTARVEYLIDAAGAFTLWDQYWSTEPPGLTGSITPVRIMETENSGRSIIIAQLHTPPPPR